MIHPIFTAVLHRPDLLARHLSNHAALMKAELAATGRSLALKAIAALFAALLLLLALGLTGVAVMLAFAQGFHSALIAVPAIAWGLLLISVGLAMHRSTAAQAREEVMREIEADLQLLRHVKGETDERERERHAGIGEEPPGPLARRAAGPHGLSHDR
ncbi:MAG: phage holin family protein [Variovorax sp.]|nr:phage holin family protein [Variovorax sp.]